MSSLLVKVWLGYQKGPFPFVFSGPLHLKHVFVTRWHIHIEILIFFMIYIYILLMYYYMHNMSNLNKFQDSYQVLEKI